MHKWVENLKAYIDFFCGRYKYRIEKDSSSCKKFFAEVFLNELQRYGEIGDIEKYDPFFITCYDKKYNRLVGCLDFLEAKNLLTNKNYVEFYSLNKLPLDILNKTAIIDHMAILPDYRKKLVSAGLFMEVHKYLLDHDFEYLFVACEPGLVHLYTQLGFRTTGTVNQWLDGIHLVHLYVSPTDYATIFKFLPFFFVALSRGFPRGKDIYKIEKYISADQSDVRFRYLTFNEIDQFDVSLTVKLSKAAKRSIFKGAALLFPKKGESVIMQFDGSKSVAIVYSGSFGVMLDNFEIAILGPGNVIGEMSYILKIPRSTSVINREENSSILILGLSAFQSLNTADLLTLWRNLTSIEARRLYAVDQKFRELIKSDEK